MVTTTIITILCALTSIVIFKFIKDLYDAIMLGLLYNSFTIVIMNFIMMAILIAAFGFCLFYPIYLIWIAI